MNLVLGAFTLGTAVILFGKVKANVLECGISFISKEVSRDVFDQTPPMTNQGKCIYECILRVTNMLGENGLIDADKFVDYLRTSKKYNDSMLTIIKTTTDNCKGHKHLSENKCETAALFLQCSSEESMKNGWDPMITPKAIHYIYYSDPRQYTEDPPERKGTFLFNWPNGPDWWPTKKKSG